jgi:hypothetical protein
MWPILLEHISSSMLRAVFRRRYADRNSVVQTLFYLGHAG